jgi:excisionase family DNA binding protein
LAIKTATLRAWILQGKIPYIRLSARAIRLRKSDLEKILERRFVPAREPAAAAR